MGTYITDGTSRRQIALQNLVIGLLDGNVLKPLILSSSIISEDETSENQVKAIMLKAKKNYIVNIIISRIIVLVLISLPI